MFCTQLHSSRPFSTCPAQHAFAWASGRALVSLTDTLHFIKHFCAGCRVHSEQNCFNIMLWVLLAITSISTSGLHRENSPVTQTSPEPTLLSWGGGPPEKFPPHPWPHGKPGLIALIGPLRPYCSQSPLILLRCVTEIKFAQNLRWLGNWH